MIIYEAFRDFSDEYEQDYASYGYYLDKKKALERVKQAIQDEEDEINEEEMKNLEQGRMYDVYCVGVYGVKKIEVIE
jgi:hypothetical protein